MGTPHLLRHNQQGFTGTNMKTGRIDIPPVKFGDMSGGIANAYPAHSLAKNQVADAINALFEKRGISKHNGFVGLDNQLESPIRGHFCYKKQDGTELNIAVSGSKVYSVDLSVSTFTELATITSDTECYALNVRGKLWLCNGYDFVKIESTGAVYRVGIAAPVGFTATAGTGGSLPAGPVAIYASYSRVGSAVLHSAPQLINTALSVSASGKVTITATASTDPQVNKITIWMTDPSGSTVYYYGNANNTTGSIVISNDSNKIASQLMYEQAAGNQLPQAFTNIWLADGRLMGCVANSNMIYYSNKAQNEFDLERWPTEYNIPTIPYNVLSGHVLNGDLFINTVGGMYKFGGCDLASKAVEVTPGSMCNTNVLYFPKNNLRSIVEYNGALWGFTNDGFRVFDGASFSIDLSKHIKPTIDKMMSSSGNFPPAAFIYRRNGKRTEYRVSFNDTELSTVSSNRSLILNLDTIVISDNENYNASWELTSTGFHSGYVNSLNAVVIAQNNSSIGLIAQESGAFNNLCLDDAGVLITEQSGIRIYIKTRMFMGDLAGVDQWQRMYLLRKTAEGVVFKLLIEDNNPYNFPVNFEKTGGQKNVLDGPKPLTLPFVLTSDSPEEKFYKAPQNARGNTMALEIEQSAIDSNFAIYEIEMYGFHEGNNFV